VERQSAEQKLTNSVNQMEKDKLTLARITGLAMDQKFNVAGPATFHALTSTTIETATEEAMHSRADLASAEASVHAAESALRAEKAQRFPIASVSGDYGGGGANVANLSQVYTISAGISVPLYTGGRIHADIEQAQAELARRRAEYEDLRGRIAYDVRASWLDVGASESAVKVAESNRALAEKALTQSRDRYANGVTNYLEVVQAQEVVASANDNYIQSLYSFNVATIALARAMGGADTRVAQLLGGN
jgi:outer membrane protein TolC